MPKLRAQRLVTTTCSNLKCSYSKRVQACGAAKTGQFRDPLLLLHSIKLREVDIPKKLTLEMISRNTVHEIENAKTRRGANGRLNYVKCQISIPEAATKMPRERHEVILKSIVDEGCGHRESDLFFLFIVHQSSFFC